MYQSNPLFRKGELIRKRPMSPKDVLAAADGTEGRVFVVSPKGETGIQFDSRVRGKLEIKPKHV